MTVLAVSVFLVSFFLGWVTRKWVSGWKEILRLAGISLLLPLVLLFLFALFNLDQIDTAGKVIIFSSWAGLFGSIFFSSGSTEKTN